MSRVLDIYAHVHVDGYGDRWYLAYPDGSKAECDGQIYKRAQDAKRALTMLRKCK